MPGRGTGARIPEKSIYSARQHPSLAITLRYWNNDYSITQLSIAHFAPALPSNATIKAVV